MAHLLTKSKYVRGLQCTKAMYLDVHNPKLAIISPETKQKFIAGREFEATFKATFPKGIDISARLKWKMSEYPRLTQELLNQEGEVVLFEAGFMYNDVLVLADVVKKTADGMLHIFEVKNGTSVSETFKNDVAIQHYVISHNPFPIAEFGVIYNDGNDGFLYEELLEEAALQASDIHNKVEDFKKIVLGDEPEIAMGEHCDNPYECPYKDYCKLGTQIKLPFSY